jgi:hypothetical protein
VPRRMLLVRLVGPADEGALAVGGEGPFAAHAFDEAPQDVGEPGDVVGEDDGAVYSVRRSKAVDPSVSSGLRDWPTASQGPVWLCTPRTPGNGPQPLNTTDRSMGTLRRNASSGPRVERVWTVTGTVRSVLVMSVTTVSRLPGRKDGACLIRVVARCRGLSCPAGGLWTATPATSSPRMSHSPVWMPALNGIGVCQIADTNAH